MSDNENKNPKYLLNINDQYFPLVIPSWAVMDDSQRHEAMLKEIERIVAAFKSGNISKIYLNDMIHISPIVVSKDDLIEVKKTNPEKQYDALLEQLVEVKNSATELYSITPIKKKLIDAIKSIEFAIDLLNQSAMENLK